MSLCDSRQIFIVFWDIVFLVGEHLKFQGHKNASGARAYNFRVVRPTDTLQQRLNCAVCSLIDSPIHC